MKLHAPCCYAYRTSIDGSKISSRTRYGAVDLHVEDGFRTVIQAVEAC